MKWFIDLHQRLLADSSQAFLTKLILILLVPLSLVYGLVSWLRLWCYQCGISPTYKSYLPVISVGNLSVGGTGKTPVVDWLVKQLQEKGWQPAIVSRGYGGDFNGAVGFVSAGKETLMSPSDAGDEPFLLAKRNPLVPVLIARKRVHAIKEIERTGCADVIVLDDAFQHHAIARDLDIVLLDAKRPFGNGWPLPAGNLREFPRALRRADILLRTRAGKGPPTHFYERQTFNSRHQLADVAVSLTGERTRLCELRGMKLVAFAGIADPSGFFSSLELCGLQLKEKFSLPDHVNYSAQQVASLRAVEDDFDAYITTEKDAVKLVSDLFRRPCYQVPLVLEVDEWEELIVAINSKLRSTP